MAHFIDKDALVAEIEKSKAEALQKKSQCKRHGLEKIMHQISAYNKVLSFIDTLEVKEMDLEKEIREEYYKVGFKKGKRAAKRQMIKDAVDGYVTLTMTGIQTIAATVPDGKYKFDDKVKLIIIKEG